MKLTQYLNSLEKKISATELARAVGCSDTTIYNMIYGRDIKLSLAVKIERFTNSKVTCKDIYEEFIEKPKKK